MGLGGLSGVGVGGGGGGRRRGLGGGGVRAAVGVAWGALREVNVFLGWMTVIVALMAQYPLLWFVFWEVRCFLCVFIVLCFVLYCIVLLLCWVFYFYSFWVVWVFGVCVVCVFCVSFRLRFCFVLGLLFGCFGIFRECVCFFRLFEVFSFVFCAFLRLGVSSLTPLSPLLPSPVPTPSTFARTLETLKPSTIGEGKRRFPCGCCGFSSSNTLEGGLGRPGG